MKIHRIQEKNINFLLSKKPNLLRQFISFFSIRISNKPSDCRRCKLSVFSAVKLFRHLQRVSHSYYWVKKSKIQLVEICIFCLQAIFDYGNDCKKTAVFHPIIPCKSNAKNCRILTSLFSHHVDLLKIGRKIPPNSSL